MSVYDTGADKLPAGFSWTFDQSLRARLSRLPLVIRSRPPCGGRPDKRRTGCITFAGGDGISTVCPSPTPFGLGLGPPEHQRTNLADEILGFRRQRFSLCFSLLIPGFALLFRPAALALDLQPTAGRSPTTPIDQESMKVRTFGAWLEPR